jgi:DNA-binding MarR family transcriptional regulator
VLVTLTPAGTRLIKKLFPEINKREQAAVSGLTLRQQEMTADFLRQLVLATGHPEG